MKVLAVDPATVTGWAITDGTYGRLELTGTWGEKLQQFFGFFLVKAEFVHLIAYEKPAGRFHNAIVSGSKLAGVLEMVGAMTGTPVVNYTPPQIKKHATGRGNATKIQMVEASRQHGYEGDDDNIADALHLMKLAMHEHGN